MKLRLFAAPAVALLLASAAAQFSADPFYERTDALRHAHALTMIEVRLAAIDALREAGELNEEADDLIEEAGETLPLLAGSLAREDEQLLADIVEALEALEEAFEEAADGRDGELAEAVGRIGELVERAWTMLVPADLRAEPTFRAALAARLLLAEDGVAEAYEDAIEEDLWEYPLGWAALQRVKELWAELEADADEDLAADVNEALAELDELFPNPQPPANLGGDPEEAEEPAHSIVSLLERITDAQLHPDRELGRLAGLTFELAQRGCEEYSAQNRGMGLELLLGAREYYDYLADTASLLAADVHEQVEGALGELDDREPEEVEASCPALLEGLEAIRRPFGG